MPTDATVVDNSGTHVHHISFRGFTGVIFWLLFVAILLFLVAFATEGWAEAGATKLGLWRSCACSGARTDSWFKASQAMFAIAFIFLIATMVLAGLYMIFHSLNKNTVLFLLIISTFISVLFLFIGLIVFGVEIDKESVFDLSFSFAFACISTILCFVAGLMAVYQKIRAKQS